MKTWFIRAPPADVAHASLNARYLCPPEMLAT